MKTGKCPKCGSADVRTSKGAKRGAGPGSNIQIGKFNFQSAKLDTYVCLSCAYVENYVAEQDKLATIAERWPRAGMEVH